MLSASSLLPVDRFPPIAVESAGAGQIRALTDADIPAVSRLFQKNFRSSNIAVSESLIAYLRNLFLEHPWQQADIHSRVFVDADARIRGFIGVLPLVMSNRGRSLRAAVACSLMVENPQHNPMAGARLLRSMLQGPQDLSISESANPVAQRMWERLGARSIPAYSMEWVRVLRPMAFPLAVLAEQFFAAKMLQPLAAPLDHLLGRIKRNPLALAFADTCRTRGISVDDEEFISVLPQFLASYPLRPHWDLVVIRWILQHAATKERYGLLQRRLVYRSGRLVGGYLYYGRPRGIAFVLQIFAQSAAIDAVIENLLIHAFEHGCVALRGRAQPEITDALLRHQCLFLHRSSMMVHSKNLELINIIRSGDALITGLAAESWTRMIGGEFL